jgi:hypothetical protein
MIHVTFSDGITMLFHANQKVWACEWMSENGEYFSGESHVRAGELEVGIHVIAMDGYGPIVAETTAKIVRVKRISSLPDWIAPTKSLKKMIV